MPARDPHPASADGDRSLLTAAVVHDVNQMLAVITGRAGLLLKQVADEGLARHLQAILLASGDAADMLKRLRTDAADKGAKNDTAGLAEVAEQARLLVWPHGDEAWRWVNELNPAWRTMVPAQVLREVLCNLFLNALAVMPDGGRLVLAATLTDDRIILRVADDGPGLPQGNPEVLFTAGVSGSRQKGRGIGLAGCRQLLADVGGNLAAETGADKGAVFVLDLPAARGIAETVVVGPDDPAVSVPATSVLVVDDEAGVREMLRDVLIAWGCRVQACRDGKTTLVEYEPGSAAVALIDRRLPGLSGLELATRLRVGDPCLSIVMVSGWRQDEGVATSDPALVDQTADKPLDLARIADILREGHELNRSRRARVDDK